MAQYGKSSGIKWGGFKYVSAHAPVPPKGTKMNDKVARKIKGLPDKDASDKVKKAVDNCTGTQLDTPEPPEVAEAKTAQENFETARVDTANKKAAYDASIGTKNNLRAVAEAKYDKLCGVVEKKADGDGAFIIARGCEVVNKGVPLMMTQVTNMVATPGDGEGQANWMCDPQTGAMFLIQTSADVLPRVWVNQEPSKISSGTITGLPSLSRQWIRAAAKGSNNTGGWSDPALAVIP